MASRSAGPFLLLVLAFFGHRDWAVSVGLFPKRGDYVVHASPLRRVHALLDGIVQIRFYHLDICALSTQGSLFTR